MRAATYLAAFFALLSLATAQDVCSPVLSCSAALSTVTVPAPFYALNFSTDPRSTGAVYGWATQGINEASCPSAQYHAGVAQFVGASHDTTTLGPSINLTAAATDANGVSTPLGAKVLFGTGTSLGSSVDGSKGWSIEVVAKSTAQGNSVAWSKIFDIGLGDNAGFGGHGQYDTLLGWHGGDNYYSWTADAADNGGSNYDGIVSNVVVGQWYHMVMVFQELSSGNADWLFYTNGNLTTAVFNNYFPPAVLRASAQLARSNWADNYWVGEIDTFNLYNYALTAPQTAALAAEAMGGCAVTYGLPTLAAPTPAPAAFWEATFDTDPRTDATVTNYMYGWEKADADDATCGLDSTHQGLLVLNGLYVPNNVPGGYVNLSQSSGPYSIGANTLPIIGGPSAGTGEAAGWSFEVTFKPEVVYTWAKLFDIAAPQNTSAGDPCMYDILLGFEGSSVNDAYTAHEPTLQFDVCSRGQEYQFGGWSSGVALGTWSHVVVTIMQMPSNPANGLYTAYLNGQVQASMIAYYPEAVVRANADIGRSSWDDSYWGGLLDTFRIYNQALSSSQVQSLTTTALGTAGTLRCPMATTLPTALPTDALLYSLTFDSDPTTAAGNAPGAALYQWAPFDPSDSAAYQAVHRGVLILNGAGGPGFNGSADGLKSHDPSGALGPYVNLSAPTGPASVGKVLPLFATDSLGLWSQGSVGFSVEISFKARQAVPWSKIYDLGAVRQTLGSGTCNGDLVLGWYDNKNQLEYEFCTDGNSDKLNNITQSLPVDASGALIPQWFHVLSTYQQTYSNEAILNVYVNGVNVVVNNNVSYPFAEYRRDATLAFSDWDDYYGNATYDKFNVYGVALNPAQAAAAYTAATTVAVAPSAPSSSSGAAAPASSSSAASAASAVSSSSAASAGVVSSSSAASAAGAGSSSSSAAAAGVSSSSSAAAAARSSSSSSATVATPSSSTATIVATSAPQATSATQPTSATSAPVVLPASSSSSVPVVVAVPSSSTAAGGAPVTINAAASTASSVVVLAVSALLALVL